MKWINCYLSSFNSVPSVENPFVGILHIFEPVSFAKIENLTSILKLNFDSLKIANMKVLKGQFRFDTLYLVTTFGLCNSFMVSRNLFTNSAVCLP